MINIKQDRFILGIFTFPEVTDKNVSITTNPQLIFFPQLIHAMPAFILFQSLYLDFTFCNVFLFIKLICAGFMFLIQQIGLSTILLGSYQVQSFHRDTVEGYVYIS